MQQYLFRWLGVGGGADKKEKEVVKAISWKMQFSNLVHAGVGELHWTRLFVDQVSKSFIHSSSLLWKADHAAKAFDNLSPLWFLNSNAVHFSWSGRLFGGTDRTRFNGEVVLALLGNISKTGIGKQFFFFFLKAKYLSVLSSLEIQDFLKKTQQNNPNQSKAQTKKPLSETTTTAPKQNDAWKFLSLLVGPLQGILSCRCSAV